MTKPTPPQISGLPVIGNLPEFLRDKMSLIERGYDEHGEIFSFRLGNQRTVMLLGPENAKKFFEMTDKELSIQESMRWLEPVIGTVGILGGYERYMEERKIVAPLLGGRYMNDHVEAMIQEVSSWMGKAGDNGTFDINDFCQHITMYVAARALLGEDFRNRLGDEFVANFHALANGVDQVLPANLPLPRFRKRDKARQELDIMLGELVDERRAHPEKFDDFFQVLVNAELEDGSQFSRERLISLILLVIFAGFDTTSGHLAWGFIKLLQHDDLRDIVLDEIDEVFTTTDTLTLQHLRDMPHLNYTMLEVERARPAIQVLMRVVKEDIEIGGYRIPAGWMAMISPEMSHKLPHVFSNPEEFDPERFNDERCEHTQHPNALTGFGGGMHKCWGLKFAYTEMSIIIAMLLRHYDLSLTGEVDEKWIAGMLRPDVQITYKERTPSPVMES